MTPTNEQIEVLKKIVEVWNAHKAYALIAEALSALLSSHAEQAKVIDKFNGLFESFAEWVGEDRDIEPSVLIDWAKNDHDKFMQLNEELSIKYLELEADHAELQAKLDAAELKWTSEKPTQEGWYWYRHTWPTVGEPQCFRYKKKLNENDSDLWAGGQWFHAELMKGEFAGPIQPPASRGSDESGT